MKKALIHLIITIASGMLLLVLLVALMDPFYHFHKPIGGAYLYNEVYQTPGMAAHFEYDTVMLGSSMTENFQTDWFGQYKENAVKLCYSGARSADLAALLKVCFESGNDIKHIYIDINDYQLTQDADSRYGEPPEYLYDNNIFNDVEYIFNKDVIIASLERLFGLKDEKDNRDDAFTWDDPALFGRDRVLEDMGTDSEEKAWESSNDDISAYEQNTLQNMENLLVYVRAHREVKFTFFYPPYSAAYWWDNEQNGLTEAKLDMYKRSIEMLLEYDNVEVYFFMDDYEHIGNLDNYRDMCHYSMEINEYMLKAMNNGELRITRENLKERFEKLREYVKEYELK